MVEAKHKGLYFALLVVSALILLIALGPGVFGVSEANLHNWQHQGFTMLCHQDPLRSFSLNGSVMAVCSRCIGIYGAFFVSVVLMPVLAHFSLPGSMVLLKFVIGVILLNIIDVLANSFSVWTNTLHSRFLLGILIGSTTALFLTNEFFKKNNKPED